MDAGIHNEEQRRTHTMERGAEGGERDGDERKNRIDVNGKEGGRSKGEQKGTKGQEKEQTLM